MKTALLLMLAACAATGCASMGPLQASAPGSTSDDESFGVASPAPSDPFPASAAPTGPGLIIPVTGGPPVVGIPLGGDLFVPVTGGAPVVGIPIGP